MKIDRLKIDTMRTLVRSILLLVMAAITVTAQQASQPAGDPARAQEILKLARAAIGDEAKLAGLKSLTAAGSSRRVFGEREIQSEVEIEIAMPDKLRRTTTSSPFPGADFQQIEVISGGQVWTDMISSMPTPGGRRAEAQVVQAEGLVDGRSV